MWRSHGLSVPALGDECELEMCMQKSFRVCVCSAQLACRMSMNVGHVLVCFSAGVPSAGGRII